jgi:membrane-associated phospholipid phosphatase
MISDQGLATGIIAVAVAVLVLRAMLWRLVGASTRFGPRLLSRIAAWPVWAQAAPLRSRLRAGYPGPDAFLEARFSPASFTGLPLTLMCLAALYAAALLGGLVDDLRETEGLVRLDQGVNAFFVPYRTPWLVAAFIWITALGAGPAITAMAATASALLWSQGRARLLVPLWITCLGAQGTTWAGKYAIGRTRPAFLDAVTAATPSFPSGHATAATALIGFLAYATARGLPVARPRFEVAFWSAVAIGLICFSRIFLSLHYLSDVAAGLLVGTFWLLAGFALAELGRRQAVP